MANSFKDYLEAELKDAGMNDDQVVAAIGKIAANEKLSSKLNGIVKTATEDYNAQVGRVNTLTQRNEYLEKDWYPKADAEYKRLQAEYNKVMGELDKGQRNGAPPDFDATKYMTKEDAMAMTQSMSQNWAGALKDVGRLASSHAVTYKEPLDMEALDRMGAEMAQARGLRPGAIPLGDVYDKFIEPRKKAAEEEGRKNWEKETRAQLERDIRSQNNLPTTPVPQEQSQMFRPTPTDERPKDMDMDLLAHWNGATPGA